MPAAAVSPVEHSMRTARSFTSANRRHLLRLQAKTIQLFTNRKMWHADYFFWHDLPNTSHRPSEINIEGQLKST